MQTIVVSFSLRNQPVDTIIGHLREIAERFSGDIVFLLYCHLSREEVVNRQLPTNLIDKLDEFFPLNLSVRMHGEACREVMGSIAKGLKAKAYVIGRTDGNVATEIAIYERNSIDVEYIAL